MCFMGTNVVSGSASALVIATGNQTYFGALAERVTAVDCTDVGAPDDLDTPQDLQALHHAPSREAFR